MERDMTDNSKELATFNHEYYTPVICIAIWPSAAKLFGRASATLFVIDSAVLT
jgi:hypothetical protein